MFPLNPVPSLLSDLQYASRFFIISVILVIPFILLRLLSAFLVKRNQVQSDRRALKDELNLDAMTRDTEQDLKESQKLVDQERKNTS